MIWLSRSPGRLRFPVYIGDAMQLSISEIIGGRNWIADLGKTYVTFDKLRCEGRDSVWAYAARNLSRPLAFAHQ
jgi:hypothetical protein